MSQLFAVGEPWVGTWLTSLWILGAGALLGLAILAAVWAVIHLFSRKFSAEILLGIQEGVLKYVLLVFCFMAGFGVVGYFAAVTPNEILESLLELPRDHTVTYTFKIPPASGEGDVLDEIPEKISVPFKGRELRSLTFNSDQSLVVTPEAEAGFTSATKIDVAGNEAKVWTRRAQLINPFSDDQVDHLFVRNQSETAATLSVTVETAPAHMEAAAIPVMALFVILVVLAYLGMRTAAPKLSAVAMATSKSEMAQPLYLILMAMGSVLLITFLVVPYNTFGEDIKVLKDSGLTLIMVLCIIQAVWASGTSVSEEIEGRTALTVLSKPIARWQFVLGKYLGIMWSVGVLFLVLGVVFLIVVAYKPIYDGRESSKTGILWTLVHFEVVRTIPGLVLAFLETSVLAAVGVAISTRLPMLANFVLCFSIYVLGHLTPLIIQSDAQAFEPVVFVGRLLATVIPVLDHFNIQAAIASGVAVPLSYLGWAFVYSLLYSAISMFLALVLFEDRDLA